MRNNQADFSFFIPATLEKAKGANGATEMRIKGVANSERSKDSDGETLEPTGFDFEPLMKTGFLNWDHQSKKTATAIIGEPTVARVINGGRDFYIEGVLYSDSEEARSVFNLAQILEKNSKTRRLGFSIEGQVIERKATREFIDEAKTIRDPLWDRIVRVRITGVAITPCPKNPNTFLEIMKGQTSHVIMEKEYDEEILKAMEVNQDLTQHDVPKEEKIKNTTSKGGKTCPKCDHDQLIDGKCLECGYEAVADSVKKSEIYNLIAEKYTTNVEKAQQIFSLIKSVNQKLFQMTDIKITKEAVDKAFQFLDNAILQKGEESVEIETPETEENQEDLLKGKNETPISEKEEPMEKEYPDGEGEDKGDDDDDDKEDFEKAKKMCKGLMEGGLSKSDTIDELVKSGCDLVLAATACASCVADASANKDGGTVSQVTAPIVKAEEAAPLETSVDELKPTTDFEGLIKGLGNQLDSKFGALGQVLKYSVEQNTILKAQIDTLTERLQEVETDLNQPMAAKSLRKSVPVSRFKGQEDGSEQRLAPGAIAFNISKSQDISALGDRLFAEHTIARENGNTQTASLLEDAIAHLEISKSLPSTILPFLAAKNIVVTAK